MEDSTSNQELRLAVKTLAQALPHGHCDSQVGLRIRLRREELGLTQNELSFPKFSAQYLSKVERGERHPSLKALVKLAFLLSTSVEWLAWGAGSPIIGKRRRVIYLQLLGAPKGDLPRLEAAAWEVHKRSPHGRTGGK